MEQRRRFHLPAVLALLLLLSALLPARADQATVQGLMNHIRTQVLDRYRGNHFARVVSLGDPGKFQSALQWATIKIDPAYCAKKKIQGEAHPSGTLTLARDPSNPPPGDAMDYGTTIWHEVIHLIEFQNGDPDGTADWNDRHTYYMEAMLRDVLGPLQALEQAAADPNVPLGTLRQRWTQIERRFERGSGVGAFAIPADLAAFKAWSGCDVDLARVEQLYRSGAAGPRLQKMLTGGMLEGLFVKGVATAAHPRGVADSSTRFDLRTNFTLAGDDPTSKWKGEVTWFLTIRGPRGHHQTARGSLGQYPLGVHFADFPFEIPDSAGQGEFTVECRLLSESQADTKSTKVTIAWPSPSMTLGGPGSVAEGASCRATGRITQGVGPFWWEWSGGGQGGTGDSLDLVMDVPQAAPPKVVYTVRLWDRARLDDRSVPPLTFSKVVTVTPKPKPSPSPSPVPVPVPVPSPAPSGPDMQVRVQYPRETAVRRPVHLGATATGGKGAKTFEWTTHKGQVLRKPTIDGKIGIPGTHTFTVRVWDEGRYKDSPKVISVQIEAFPELKGSILAPAEAADGEEVQIGQNVTGGKGPLTFTWTVPNGNALQKESLQGTIRGKPGEEKIIRLQVKDSLQPPQTLDLSHRLVVKDRGRIVIKSVTVSPSEIDPGKSARVTMEFVITGFKDPVVTANTALWLEASSGSGRGQRHDSSFAVKQGDGWKCWADLPTAEQGQSGPLRAQGSVQVGDMKVLAEGKAQLKRPGGLQDVTVDSRSVVLRLWDHGAEDGDYVTVTLNGRVLAKGYKITKKGGTVRVNLNPGPNRLIVQALNEGTSSPNTASISLSNVVRGPASQSYSLKTGQSGYFDIIAP